jgi:uncharacterized membrane protein
MFHASALPGRRRLRIRDIEIDRPWTWLSRGWNDILAAPRVSLAYGAAIVCVSVGLWSVLTITRTIHLLLPLAAGFFLIAPLIAVGLYETSRRLAAGEPVSLGAALGATRRNGAQVALMGIALLLLHLAWVRVATLLFALFFDRAHPGLGSVVDTLFFSPASLPFLVTGSLVGLGFAVVAFAIGALSIPMLIDREVDVFAAIAASVAATTRNWRPMALWAGLIVVFTAMGMATLFVGLAIAMPLVGHATWHAYRDVILSETEGG